MGHWRAIHRRTRRGSKQRKGPNRLEEAGPAPSVPNDGGEGRTALITPAQSRSHIVQRWRGEPYPTSAAASPPPTRNPDLVRNPSRVVVGTSAERVTPPPARVYRVLGRLLARGKRRASPLISSRKSLATAACSR